MDNGKIDFLKEFLIADVVAFIMEDTGVSADEAMDRFYNSQVFERLEDAGTGLYCESSAYVYELYKDECKHGRLVQTEM
jgi:predicted transcriptional regulator